jgi:hypothetical protein
MEAQQAEGTAGSPKQHDHAAHTAACGLNSSQT